jgi:hypothetical protein
MHLQHVAPSAMEPGEDDHLIPGSNALEPFENLGVEDEPSIGSTLVPLLRCSCRVG